MLSYHFKVTYCKRKKGLLKKAIELSTLCDLKMFVYVYDPKQQRVIHYASDANFDLVDIFNCKAQREYYTNDDYHRVGGRDDGDGADDAASNEDVDRPECQQQLSAKRGQRIFSRKRVENQRTSRLGTFNEQKIPLPDDCK